ncbi:MAG: 50S ribosomal protein L21 [Candidatus Harrisonbacteria bacterium CG10_big_fil_rev_8_21_14_0_10_38_8]|uniref:Large ribosomal subunit protein bL21 n=1 Tax=Candidatus Harrisonbacteria bacterium CG10_big_fil_rev_8_21_14_0_10_38_8 TaxID=1974582 RepID=A0A2M6WKW3_9BACT|nr:MAG: 50S ribosomal protein L21 [Candidatus Harrisonbacteria bacterium CG10_big_fil_rev_8_21_14_0_10_38_8]
MFAVIQTGGKQYRVSPGNTIKIEKLESEEGSDIVFDQVLLKVDGDNVSVGKPVIEGAKVTAKVLEQGRNKKVIVFKYKSKTRQRTKNTHRQPFTEVEITAIN